MLAVAATRMTPVITLIVPLNLLVLSLLTTTKKSAAMTQDIALALIYGSIIKLHNYHCLLTTTRAVTL